MMKFSMMTVGALALGTTMAFAVEPSSQSSDAAGNSAMKLSASECTNLWSEANPSNAAGLTESQSAPYVSDFKAANPDGDTTIEQDEWMTACNKGLIKASSSSGASSGSSGSANTPEKEHAPTNRMNKVVPDMKPQGE